jgi:hypothetical protein
MKKARGTQALFEIQTTFAYNLHLRCVLYSPAVFTLPFDLLMSSMMGRCSMNRWLMNRWMMNRYWNQ